MYLEHLSATDPELASAIGDELTRERNSIELIASENFVSLSVMEAVGSPLTNKYAATATTAAAGRSTRSRTSRVTV